MVREKLTHVSNTASTWIHELGVCCRVYMLCIVLVSSCSQDTIEQEKEQYLAPVGGIFTTLEDEVKELADEQISWSTYWKLCWEEYPEAEAYELQTVTSEGTSSKVKRVKEPCYRLQIASGKNDKSEGLLNRKILIELQFGQIAYKVRAVLNKNTYSAWSKAIPVEQTSEKKL